MSANLINKLKVQLIEKLKNYDCYIDDELPDYIMVMIANKKTSNQMKEDLSLFIGKHVNEFVDWLQYCLKEMKNGNDPFIDIKPKKEKIIFNLNTEKLVDETKENSEKTLTKKKIVYSNFNENELNKLKRKEVDLNFEETKKFDYKRLKIDENRNTKSGLISKVNIVKSLDNNLNEKNSSNKSFKNQTALIENKIQKSLVIKAIEEANKSFHSKKTPTSSKEIKKVSILDRLGTIDKTNMRQSNMNENSSKLIINHQSKNQIKNFIDVKSFESQINLIQSSNLIQNQKNTISKTFQIEKNVNLIKDKIIENQNKLDPQDLRHVLSKKNINKGKIFEKLNPPLDLINDNSKDKIPIKNFTKKDLVNRTINSSINLVKNTTSPNSIRQTNLKFNSDNKIEINKIRDIKKERCQYWPACPNGNKCNYHHPKTLCLQFPLCKFGEACLNIHPNCKFDLKCSKKDCPFTHLNKKLLNTKNQNSSIKTNSSVNVH